MHIVKIKPLSVNEAWRGRRFKTPLYTKWRRDIGFLLPRIEKPLPPFCLTVTFGLSNSGADIDNPTKPFLDALQDKYKINDKDIYELHLYKKLTLKGSEYIEFEIKTAQMAALS